MTDTKRANRFWGNKPLPKSKAEFFDAITTPAPSGEGTVATIRMYGPIDSYGGYWGISTQDVGQVLDALSDSVTQIILRVNSPGGEVTEAVAILNMLRAHKASVTAVVDGLAASAASVITAGCDEAVMSPGTQMMIHSPSTIVWGNAAEMRKAADTLDSFEAAITEIYTGKAGAKDWAALLAEETWLTAAEAVDLGLADRVAVVPDAGDAETVGEDEPEIVVVPLDDDVDDSAFLTQIAAYSRAPKPPVSSEPGEPNRKESAMSGDFKAGLRERLGVTDADATDETLLAALDEALAEQTNPPAAAAVSTLPDGAVVVDKAIHEQLVADAAAGRKAAETLDAQRRDGIVAAALSDGRIAPASRDAWRAQLDKDEDGTKALLESMPKNTVPVAELGHADDTQSTEDRLAAKAGWTTTVEGA
ncbi:head maturation protease, ClpP-related [Cellulomonas sp. ES6]|uniref:head maturation protease, ClpP-related n=1 Tax=Cellulomonas sp. ES6 TaxID=3039384 RepID=UPI0024B65284|nr:head maturation protease, ClpP-related [Cellulomonas sp. ES6]WHP18829.1 ATP-dependent Clp protease proteolytic subunit [Cellulomonas sp. ES6]